MKAYWRLILATLQNEESTMQQKQEAFEAVYELYEDTICIEEFNHQGEDGCYKGIVQACITIIEMNAVTNDTACVDRMKLVDMMDSCLFHMNVDDSSSEANKILNNEKVFFWIVERVMSEDNEEHDHYGSLFTSIICSLGTSGRVTLLVRYFNSLKKIVSNIFTRDVSIYHKLSITDFFGCEEMIGFVATMAYPFHKWLLNLIPKDYDRNSDLSSCNLVVKVLRSAFDSPKLLQQLLGYDLLRIAGYLAFNRANNRQAEVFREILNRYPEFQKSFRERTERGLNGNPVAILGRSIPHMPPNEGKWYILKDEDEE